MSYRKGLGTTTGLDLYGPVGGDLRVNANFRSLVNTPWVNENDPRPSTVPAVTVFELGSPEVIERLLYLCVSVTVSV